MANIVELAKSSDIDDIKSQAQMRKVTNDDGSFRLTINSGDLLDQILNSDAGFYTVIVYSNVNNVPLANQNYRGTALIQDNKTAYLTLFGASDSNMYTNGSNNGQWIGWKFVADGVALTNHINNTNNPHNVTKQQVGLSNVDNTSDVDKPISTATQQALTSISDTVGDTSQLGTQNKDSLVSAINEVNTSDIDLGSWT